MKLDGVLCLAAMLTPTLHAGIVYDNTAAASTDTDPVQSFGPLYDQFMSAPDVARITNLELLLTLNGSAPTGVLDIGLYGDNFGTPGALITSLGTLADTSLTNPIAEYNITLTANPVLAASTQYWIGLFGTTSANWSWSLDTSGPGVSGEEFSNSSGTWPSIDGPYQMAVTTTPTPEPASVLLLVSGVGLLTLYRLRAR